MVRFFRDSILRNVVIIPEEDKTVIYKFKDSVIYHVQFHRPPEVHELNCNKDVWVERLKAHERTIRRRIKRTVTDFSNGIKDRFPICCILHFCLDHFLCKNAMGSRRGARLNKYRERYVPCFLHKKYRLIEYDQ